MFIISGVKKDEISRLFTAGSKFEIKGMFTIVSFGRIEMVFGDKRPQKKRRQRPLQMAKAELLQGKIID